MDRRNGFPKPGERRAAMRNLCFRNLAHLRSELGLAIRRLRRKPPLITACLAEAGLSLES